MPRQSTPSSTSQAMPVSSTTATEPIPPEILNRKGARTTAAVPAEVRRLLNAGVIESANLSEWLIVDHSLLARQVFRSCGWEALIPEVDAALEALKTPTAMKRTTAVGGVLAGHFATARDLEKALTALKAHTSDTVRTWACAMIGQRAALSLSRKLELLMPLAADENMGVREIAWMSARPQISTQLTEAIALLLPWVQHSDYRIRRFASEATRPRGVWCQHIQQLKELPELAIPLLNPLRSDDAKYVRDSVANWLNDASKSRPDFVIATCCNWIEESPTKATTAIVRRALRTLKKKGSPELECSDTLSEFL